jgi:uncharacterized membrane protein YheB (UPF0754 family)
MSFDNSLFTSFGINLKDNLLNQNQQNQLQQNIQQQLTNQIQQIQTTNRLREQQRYNAFQRSPFGAISNKIQDNLSFLNSDFLAPSNNNATAIASTIGKKYGMSVGLGSSAESTINNLATKNVDACSNVANLPFTTPTTRLNLHEMTLNDLSKFFFNFNLKQF